METLAYLQVDEASSEKELTLEAVKMSGKLTGVMLGAAGAAIAVGLAQAPAQAYGYGGGHDSGCYDRCEPVFVGGGFQVTSYRTYDVSFKHDDGCYDDYCGVSYGGGSYGGGYGGGGDGGGCYDYCGVSYGGGGGYGGCYDPCGVATPYGGYGGGYGGGYEDISYGGGYDDGCYDYCGVSYGGGYGSFSTYDIQSALSYSGFHISVDGVFGSETHHAVKAFQQAVGLVPDGIVGPATASALGL